MVSANQFKLTLLIPSNSRRGSLDYDIDVIKLATTQNSELL